ncbi:cation diffusion facilitator family transporter [Allohahella marinimesophila]|uniref:Cation diffusion facilitator family transporter n=1 Tax=Allohahella marinimesophila TaxID=1054972 RepID=A0ABP7PN95_9GAMM
MKKGTGFEFPPEQTEAMRKARRLEWWTIAYLLSVIVLMYLTMGSSQAMKTAWMEDMLSLIPPVVLLVASRFAHKTPDARFPYGYHRVVSIAFLCASIALFTMGSLLLYDALSKLVMQEHPTIGGMTIAGTTFWQGWAMYPVLIWGAIPPFFLGRAKMPLAEKIHDKVLYADADMNKADWMTAAAAMVGITGVGLGYWWADAVAAAAISTSILRDGWSNLKQVVLDLMDESPEQVDRSGSDDLPSQVSRHLKQMAWIDDAQVRMREDGHVYFGEAFIRINDDTQLTRKLHEATISCRKLNWRVHDIVLVPVVSLDAPIGTLKDVDRPSGEDQKAGSRIRGPAVSQ